MKTSIVLGDLTALYSATVSLRRKVDYRYLNKCLREEFPNAEELKFYTVFRQSNQKQVDLVNLWREECGWKVETVESSDVHCPSRTFTDYRFDARLAFELGDLATVEESTKIGVLTDSVDMIPPMLELAKFGHDVSLIFFGDAIRGHWWKVLNNPNNRIKFFDIGDEMKKAPPRSQYPGPRDDYEDGERYS